MPAESVRPSDSPRMPMLPRVAAGAEGSATTKPEMAAIRPSWMDEIEPDNWDDTTDVVRVTEVGEPPGKQAAANHALLLRADGVLAGQVASLNEPVVTIGRHASNSIAVADAGVSRHHARLVRVAHNHVLEDVESRNGCFVGGRRVERATLHDGDLIQLGPRVSFRYARVDSQQEQLLRQLFQSSTRDSLTGVYNRRHFDERLAAEVAFAMRHGSEVSLLLIDIDFFKHVNDTYGHLGGDAALKHVARTAMHQLRAEDVFARYGGEEFAVILRGIGVAGAARAAERIRATIEVLPASHRGRIIPVKVSIGVAGLTETSGRSPSDLIARTDVRLYAAKNSGRNRVIARG